VGRSDLASEIFQVAIHRVSQAFVPGAELLQEHIRFLTRQRQFESAERELVQTYHGFIPAAAPLIVDLYRAWDRLDQMGKELDKYFLPAGVEKEVLFLARQPAP